MEAFRNRFATDGRDKVYGVLGLIDEDELNRCPPLSVDYSLSIPEVCAIATAYMICFYDDLHVLPGPYEPQRPDDLLSWVVDWSFQEEGSHSKLLHRMYEGLYCGSRNNRRTVSLYSDLILSVSGRRIDAIKVVGNITVDDPPDHDPPEVFSWLHLTHSKLKRSGSTAIFDPSDPQLWFDLERSKYNSNDNFLSTFCRTIVADVYEDVRRCTPEDVSKLRRWLNRGTANTVRGS